MRTVKHPEATAHLSKTDSNVYALIGEGQNALRRAKVSREEIDAFRDECFDQDGYDKVIQTIMKWMEVD